MGWDDYFLHYFHIYGEDYGIRRPGATCFRHDVNRVFLEDFGFEVGDRFAHTYNFYDDWLCDVRVEAIGPHLGSKQKFTAGMGAVLRIGLDRITVPDDYRFLELEKIAIELEIAKVLNMDCFTQRYCLRQNQQLE
jgi:hypothetical protein